jgi:uncharacterized lipoprotein YddW (UPF0748 family)
MPLLALVLVVLAVASGACAILIAVRRRRTPPELRGDWWTPFEREFRAFASQQAARRERERRRHRGERA